MYIHAVNTYIKKFGLRVRDQRPRGRSRVKKQLALWHEEIPAAARLPAAARFFSFDVSSGFLPVRRPLHEISITNIVWQVSQ